jgi:hypothetical protein
MNDWLAVDEQIGELVHRELPVPEHREGYRETVAALLTAEAVARQSRKRWWPGGWWPGLEWPTAGPVGEPDVMKKVAPRQTRRPRVALVAAIACILVIAVAAASVAALQSLREPVMVLRITDETVVDASDPATTRTTIVATSLASLEDTKKLLENLVAAINANDTPSVRKFYLSSAFLNNNSDGTDIQGSVGIANYWREARDALGVRIEAVGDPLPYDRYILLPVEYSLPNQADTKNGALVFQINADGLIAREWITGWVTE